MSFAWCLANLASCLTNRSNLAPVHPEWAVGKFGMAGIGWQPGEGPQLLVGRPLRGAVSDSHLALRSAINEPQSNLNLPDHQSMAVKPALSTPASALTGFTPARNLAGPQRRCR
jgi:hypothetical protein